MLCGIQTSNTMNADSCWKRCLFQQYETHMRNCRVARSVALCVQFGTFTGWTFLFCLCLNKLINIINTLWFKKNAPTLADYNYEPVQSILIIFSKLFINDHKSCLVVKFSTSPHICCHYTLWNTMLYFSLITLLIAKNAPTSDHFNKC